MNIDLTDANAFGNLDGVWNTRTEKEEITWLGNIFLIAYHNGAGSAFDIEQLIVKKRAFRNGSIQNGVPCFTDKWIDLIQY